MSTPKKYKGFFNRDLLAKMIYQKRVKENISFGQIQEETGLSKSVVYNFEAKKGSPSVENFAIVCEWLGVDPNEFFRTVKK